MQSLFSRFAAACARAIGSPVTFVTALTLIVAWAVAGPFCHYSDSWQLLVNTGTTISTGLIVFVLQCSANHESKALHLKIDELIRSSREADDRYRAIEKASEERLAELTERMPPRPDEAEENAEGITGGASRDAPRGGR